MIRALRNQGIDLQQRIHQDMSANFKYYPKIWGLKSTDKNIDHRRVPNIMTYFKRKEYQVYDDQFKTGDIVTWDLGRGLTHIGIISNRRRTNQTPFVIQNIGHGTQEDDILFQYKMIGHYRIPMKVDHEHE